MSDPKPFASLGPSLLARKGSARPAMRPQLAVAAVIRPIDGGVSELCEDDLGWNDMGPEHFGPEHFGPEHFGGADDGGASAPVPGPAIASAPAPTPAPTPAAGAAAKPAVTLRGAEPAAAAQLQGLIIPAGRRSALANGRRCAFTLRVDAERHLKLRLACTLRNRSAQQLLTDALDQLLGELPELADLARQMARKVQN